MVPPQARQVSHEAEPVDVVVVEVLGLGARRGRLEEAGTVGLDRDRLGHVQKATKLTAIRASVRARNYERDVPEWVSVYA